MFRCLHAESRFFRTGGKLLSRRFSKTEAAYPADENLQEMAKNDIPEIAEKLGIKYLAEAKEVHPLYPIRGIFWSKGLNRPFVSIHVDRDGIGTNVPFFLWNNSSHTFLSTEVLDFLQVNPSLNSTLVSLHRTPFKIYRSPKDSKIANVCVLGADFIEQLNLHVNMDLPNNRVILDRVGQGPEWQPEQIEF